MSVDQKVAQLLRNLLRPGTKQKPHLAESQTPNAQLQRRRSNHQATTDLHESLGIKRAQPSVAPKNPFATGRSDDTPGLYVCIECNNPINLQEAWRAPSSAPGMNNTSTLFCIQCAQRVNQIGGLRLGPIQFDAFDMLNMGQRCKEFEDPTIVPKPIPELQPQSIQENQETAANDRGVNKWNKLLGG